MGILAGIKNRKKMGSTVIDRDRTTQQAIQMPGSAIETTYHNYTTTWAEIASKSLNRAKKGAIA